MAFKVRMELAGFAEFVDELKELGSTKARAIVRRGVQAASTPIMREIKRRTPVDSGQLKRSIGKRIKTYRSTGVTIAVIGPREGFKARVIDSRGKAVLRNPVKYAHLVELGHRIALGGTLERKGPKALGKPKRQGRVGGFVAGREFLRGGFLAAQSQAQNAMTANIRGAINREWERIAARTAGAAK